MKISIVGTGYVGLVTGTCFAEVGIDVTCIDVDAHKIANLNKGIIPIFEPGLEALVNKNVEKGRLHFTTDLGSTLAGCEIVFSAVGTPPGEDGSADLSYVLEVAREIGRHMTGYLVVATKSTVPVGTAEKVKNTMQAELDARGVDFAFDVASNPEFLKEGDAVQDFLKPDRIVVGVESERARKLLSRLYKPFTLNGHPVIYMDVKSAEMTKYTANAMLATKISFINDIANLCEKVGADINLVRQGIGSDPRIGSKFIYAGVGYGGSCFPKDVKALIKTARDYDYDLRVLKAVEEVNNDQKQVLFNKVNRFFKKDLAGKHIAIWGLSFKPQTDDMREAPSLVLVSQLLHAGAKVSVYDPVAMAEAEKDLGGTVHYGSDMYEILQGAEAVVLVTEWKEFRFPDLEKISQLMKNPVIFDGRNIYDPEELKEKGFTYFGIGIK